MRKTLAILLACVLSTLVSGTFIAGSANADAGHVVTIDDVSVAEGSGGVTGLATVTLHVSPAPVAGERVKVDFGTSAIGATAQTSGPGDATPEFPEDFAQTDGTVTFEALDTDESVVVPILGDNADEPDETFFVQVFNARGECLVAGACTTGATVGDPKATVTITDDDSTPTLAIDDVELDEGNTGTTSYTFTVTKSGGNGQAVTVGYDTANDSATAPADYTAQSGTLAFPVSNSLLPATEEIVVAGNGDELFEPTEAFRVVLSNPTNATLSDADGAGTITNDDATPAPTMSVSDASAAEGDVVNHTVALSNPPGPGQTATVDWALVPTTGDGSATEGADYAIASGSVVYTAGEAEQMISIPTLEDAVDESDETYTLMLTKPATHGTGGYTYDLTDGSAAGTITDDDAAPTFSVDDVNVLIEGATEATSDAVFTVTKTGATDRTATVHYATTDGTAAAGSDYDASSGELSFAPGDTTKQVTVVVNGDDLDEAVEAFTLDLTEPTNATLSDAQGNGTITDDDDATASFAVGDVSVTEGNSGTTSAIFTVTKSGVSGQTATVAFATTNGTATSADYTATSGSLSFGALEASKTIAVPIKGDLLDELNETFVVTLSGPTNASITDGSAAGTITDNDAAPRITTGNDSEYETANKACTLLVKLNAPSGRAITFHYATVSGTARTNDYVAKSGNVTFVAGDAAVQVKILMRADSKDEPTEKFSVKLSGISPAGSASFADSTGTCSIIDND